MSEHETTQQAEREFLSSTSPKTAEITRLIDGMTDPQDAALQAYRAERLIPIPHFSLPYRLYRRVLANFPRERRKHERPNPAPVLGARRLHLVRDRRLRQRDGGLSDTGRAGRTAPAPTPIAMGRQR